MLAGTMQSPPAIVNRYNRGMSTCIRSRRVLLGRGNLRSVTPASLEIVGSQIVAVDAMDAASFERLRSQELPAGRTVHDLGDHLITPAFVNAHTHLALSFLRGAQVALQGNLVENLFFRYEQLLNEGDVRAFTRMGAYESLLHGVGLVWDHYYHGRAVVDALLETGLSGVVAPTLQDLSGPGKGVFEKALAETAALATQTELRAKGIFAAVGPHATDTVSSDLMGKALSLAQSHGLPIHMHLAQSIEELRRVTEREGCSPMAWLDRLGVLSEAPALLLAHALYASAPDLRLLDPARHTLALCPFSQLVFGFTAPVLAWSELGMSWVVATDCAASNDSMNLQKELRLAAALPKAGVTSSESYRDFFSHGDLARAERAQRERDDAHSRFAAHAAPSALLERAWELPGEAHPGFRAGAIEVGCLANLIAWDTDHPAFWPESDLVRALAYGDTTQAIHTMFVCGKRVGKAGDFQASVLASPEYREARLEATERLEHLIRCAG